MTTRQPALLNPVVVIPARMRSVRLPDKPLADIHGEPMIVHVWRRAVAAAVGPVVVACAEAEIARAIARVRGTACLTDPDLPSGSDRVWEALEAIDPDGDFNVVVNLQGDLPAIEPAAIRAVLEPLADPRVDIATLAVEIDHTADLSDPNVVKIAMEIEPGAKFGRCLYFSRHAVPHGEGAHWHHVGIYAYRRDALRRFVGLPPAYLEIQERLEQLRALADGMRIDARIIRSIPFGVDTPSDLERARSVISRHN